MNAILNLDARPGKPTWVNFIALDPCLLRDTEQYFDDYQLELVPDTGHFIVDEQPALVNERAFAFLTDPRYTVK